MATIKNTEFNQYSKASELPMGYRKALESDVYKYLKQKQVGDIVTYEQLSKIMNLEVPKNIVAAGIMVAVKKTLERDDGKCFKTIRSVGIKLLNSAETVEVIDGNISRIGRIAKSGLQTLSTVNYNELTDQEKTDFNRKSGVLGVMKMSAMPKTQNKIEHYFKMGTIDNTKVLEALMAASSK